MARTDSERAGHGPEETTDPNPNHPRTTNAINRALGEAPQDTAFTDAAARWLARSLGLPGG